MADWNDPEHTPVARQFGTTTKSWRELREWWRWNRGRNTGRPLPAVLGASAINGGSERAEIGFCGRLAIVKRLLSQDLTLSYVPDAEQRRRRIPARYTCVRVNGSEWKLPLGNCRTCTGNCWGCIWTGLSRWTGILTSRRNS